MPSTRWMRSQHFDDNDVRFMRLAIEEAEAALRRGDGPVGAVLARDGMLVARGGNLTVTGRDRSAHAEVVVLRLAAPQLFADPDVPWTLYTTFEPCLACTGTAVLHNVPRIVYGARDPEHDRLRRLSHRIAYHDRRTVVLVGGCLPAECVHPLNVRRRRLGRPLIEP